MLARLLRADNPSIALDELPPAAAAAMVRRWCPSLASDLILAEAASAPDCAQVEVVSDRRALRALLEEAQQQRRPGHGAPLPPGQRHRSATKRPPAASELDLVDLVRLPSSPARVVQGVPSSPDGFAQQALRSAFETPLLGGLLAGIQRAGRDALEGNAPPRRAGSGRHKRTEVASVRQLHADARRRPAARSNSIEARQQRGHSRYGPI